MGLKDGIKLGAMEVRGTKAGEVVVRYRMGDRSGMAGWK